MSFGSLELKRIDDGILKITARNFLIENIIVNIIIENTRQLLRAVYYNLARYLPAS